MILSDVSDLSPYILILNYFFLMVQLLESNWLLFKLAEWVDTVLASSHSCVKVAAELQGDHHWGHLRSGGAEDPAAGVT